MTIGQTHLTSDEFIEKLGDLDNGKRYELVAGAIIEMSPSSAKPTVIAQRIGYYLSEYVIQHDEPGYVASADGGFKVSAQDTLSPDVAYISKQRQPKLPERFFTQAPELAVEFVSPTDCVKQVQRKAKTYLDHGTRIVWIVYPKEQTVDVCHLADDGSLKIQERTKGEALAGEDVLPGFTLPVQSIFLT